MDPAFQRRCSFCNQLLPSEVLISRHVCNDCGMPQPISSDSEKQEDFFFAFGVQRRFAQDLSLLEKRFYEFSRALHPDRFTLAGNEAKALSLSRMSFINQAYGTLKDRVRLRDYLLALEGITRVGKAQSPQVSVPKDIPLELVEAWFEIQEGMTEDPTSEEVQARLREFEKDLEEAEKACERRLSELERNHDSSSQKGQNESIREILETIYEEVQKHSYLKSLQRDLSRFTSRFKGN